MKAYPIIALFVVVVILGVVCSCGPKSQGTTQPQATKRNSAAPTSKAPAIQSAIEGQLNLVGSAGVTLVKVSEQFNNNRSLTKEQIVAMDDPQDMSVSDDPMDLTINTRDKQKWIIEFAGCSKGSELTCTITWDESDQKEPVTLPLHCDKGGTAKLTIGLNLADRTWLGQDGRWRQ